MDFKVNDLSAFTCETIVFGVSYRITYTQPKRGEYWEAVVGYPLVERTFFSSYASIKDIKALYNEVKNKGTHMYPSAVKPEVKPSECYEKCEKLFELLSKQEKQKLIDNNILYASTDRVVETMKVRQVKIVIKTKDYEVENFYRRDKKL